ncbi:hypothetical protein ABPG72_019614 [Tetrahymena utriculariae]
MKKIQTSNNLGVQGKTKIQTGMSKTLHKQIGIKKSVTDMIQKYQSALHNSCYNEVYLKDQNSFQQFNSQMTDLDITRNNVRKNQLINIQNKKQTTQKQEGFKIQVKANQTLQKYNCCLCKQEIQNQFNGIENLKSLKVLSVDLRTNNYDQESLLMMLTDISRCLNIENLEIIIKGELELVGIKSYKFKQRFKSQLPRLVEYQHDSLENIDFLYQENNDY